MNFRYTLGFVLVPFAIGVCLLLGTFGWFALGFGMMTDCTNNYDCSTSGCPPCAGTESWINAGGLIRWILAAAGTLTLVRGARSERWSALVIGGAVVVVASALTFVGTTSQAAGSYCQPGTAGYELSYCSTSA